MTRLEGVLVADKPAGPTSHDIVEQVRRFTPGLRVGHTGTLDPFATGVLPLCIGRATRLARFLTSTRKSYSGVIRLGVTTDTYDIAGRPVAEGPVPMLDRAIVSEAASKLTGTISQTPPRFSARKINGRPMHQLARQGREVLPRPATVTVYRFDIVEVTGALVRFEAETSPGTYVRSLAHDLGAALGCGACLAELRRDASGGFRIASAHTIEEILARGLDGTLTEIVIPLDRIDLGMPSVTVTAEGLTAMRTGRALAARDCAAGLGAAAAAGAVRVEDQEGRLLGVARAAVDPCGDRVLRPDVVLVV